MRFIIGVFIALFCLSNAAVAASFDCSRFNTGVYKIICNSPELSRLDDELSRRYESLDAFSKVLGSDSNEAFRRLVQTMLKERNSCATESCLLAWYGKAMQTYDELEKAAQISPIISNQPPTQITPDWTMTDGRPSTMDKESNTMAFLNYSKGGGIDFYILPFEADHNVCRGWQGGVEVMESFHFNGVLVQMARSCNSNLIYFMPLTRNGSNYIFNQFRTRNNVRVTDSRGRPLFNFGAVGFTKALQQFIDNSGRTGGL